MPVLRLFFAAVLLLTGVGRPWRRAIRPGRCASWSAFRPEGPTDVIARLVAQQLSDSLGQQFFVENLPGAGGNTASGQVARAAPDGYTIMAISTTGPAARGSGAAWRSSTGAGRAGC